MGTLRFESDRNVALSQQAIHLHRKCRHPARQSIPI
ncbi:hypothetical protein AAKU58_004349 [Oxalobacteraceae bacterium GrIS 1.18]